MAGGVIVLLIYLGVLGAVSYLILHGVKTHSHRCSTHNLEMRSLLLRSVHVTLENTQCKVAISDSLPCVRCCNVLADAPCVV